MRFGDDYDDLGIGSAFLKEATNRDEIENLPNIPALDELPSEPKRLLVVEEIVLLKHGEHAAGGQYLHGFVQEEIGELLVG